MNLPRPPERRQSDHGNACPTAHQRPRTIGAASALVVVAALVLSGCGGGSDGEAQKTPSPDSPASSSSAPSNTPATTSSAPEAEEGELTLGSGELVHYRCVGEGEPAILLEAGTGSGGTDSLPLAFIHPLAEAVRVCTYDRLGTGLSDPAPDRKRTVDDLCDVQDQVRDQLKLREPTVLVGQSGGANLVIWCASRRPASVAALVSIEGYHDDPADLAAEGFNWRKDTEHVDYVGSSTLLDEISMPIGKFPVLVITATESGPRGARNQKYWLALSSRSRQVVMQGGHDLHEEIPSQVAAEILRELPKH